MTSRDRRLVAIVVADIVGYSAMMERDEADTISRVFALRSQLLEPAITTRGGRVVKTMGDGLLAEFPSAVHAIDAAIAVQEGLGDWPDVGEPLRLRIGVHVGDVAVEDDDLFGDGVNIAARLEQRSDPGGILISGIAHDHTSGHFGDRFEHAGDLKLKNISRPMPAWRWSDASSQAPPSVHTKTQKPAIAVLPFDNLSTDAEQDYLADGMVEDLTTMLSRFHWFRVIARNSSFAVDRVTEDVSEVAAKLGARYVLEGSVRRAGDRIRVSVQLIDCETSTHIWGDRFDRVLEDLFDLQDEMVRSIVGAVVPEFVSSFQPSRRGDPTTSISSWELAMRGWNLARRADQSSGSILRTRDLFERALEEDDANALAHCGLAYSYSNPYYVVNMDRDVPKAIDAAQQALDIDNTDAFAWCLSGVAHLYGKSFTEAERRLKKAIAINPSLALAYGYMTLVSALRPDSAAADEWAARLQDLSPEDPMAPLLVSMRALARFGEADYHGALTLADEGLEHTRELQPLWRMRAASLEMLDEHEAATAAVASLLELAPITMTQVREIATPFMDAQPWEIYLHALKDAGIPE